MHKAPCSVPIVEKQKPVWLRKPVCWAESGMWRCQCLGPSAVREAACGMVLCVLAVFCFYGRNTYSW